MQPGTVTALRTDRRGITAAAVVTVASDTERVFRP
jgi:hypothetical protein